MNWSYDRERSPKENMSAFLDEALSEDPHRNHKLLWHVYLDSSKGLSPTSRQYHHAFRIMVHDHPLRKAVLPLSAEARRGEHQKLARYRRGAGAPLTEKELSAPPPKPGHLPDDALKRMAADILKMAWDVASGKVGDTRMAGRAGSEFGQAVAAVYRKYDAAWLQNPDATALWAGILGIDPEVIAERSRARHGDPTLTEEEKEVLRTYKQHRANTGSGDWRLR